MRLKTQIDYILKMDKGVDWSNMLELIHLTNMERQL